ncbi:MAG: putative F420-dependent oxidoreductase [Acidimicrobiales bacterium]|jgi:probable F420-dependent oxidoreductase
MKLSVEFPSVAYREGPEKVTDLGQAIERIGYDEIAVFDHVVMGYPHPGRDDSRYPPQMPVLEAIVLMTWLAAATKQVGLATEVLVLPQRQPALVAKQISTLDTLSGGRVRLGIGVGWQESEFDALHESFRNRGKRMDEAIALLRAYFADEQVDLKGEFYPTAAMAMEPKPPQGAKLPIWIGGLSKAAIRRTALFGDGWMGSAVGGKEKAVASRDEIRRQAAEAGRDPAAIGMQMMLQPPPTDEAGKQFYADLDVVAARAVELAELDFEWLAINATAIFQSGSRSVSAIEDQLGAIHERLTAELS